MCIHFTLYCVYIYIYNKFVVLYESKFIVNCIIIGWLVEVILEAEIQHGNIAHIWRGIEMVQYAITVVW